MCKLTFTKPSVKRMSSLGGVKITSAILLCDGARVDFGARACHHLRMTHYLPKVKAKLLYNFARSKHKKQNTTKPYTKLTLKNKKQINKVKK